MGSRAGNAELQEAKDEQHGSSNYSRDLESDGTRRSRGLSQECEVGPEHGSTVDRG